MRTVASKTAALARRVTLVLTTGYTLYFFSEVVFWSEPGRVPFGEAVATWLVYSLLAFVLLDLVTRFHVRNIWGVFLAGAVVGWLAEGVVVQTVVESLPLSISFTGLAWHASISVLVGWYLVGEALRRHDVPRLLTVSAALGAFWGVWAIWAWVDLGRVDPVGAFVVHAFVTSAPMIGAYAVQYLLGGGVFRPTKVGEVAVGALFLSLFIGAVIAAPIELLLTPLLMAVAIIGLRRNQRAMPASTAQPDRGWTRSSWVVLVPLLLIPGIATAVYATAFALHLRWQTGWVVYAISTAAGFWFFINAFRRSSRAATAAER
jgi:hypothetical protein